ncbi:MAG: FG-GAP-like repeat-containing protein [Thermoplasmatota archaeon]
MKNKYVVLLIMISICILPLTAIHAQRTPQNDTTKQVISVIKGYDTGEYVLQWQMNFGRDSRYGARYEGPQPIGDCNHDSKNEMLISGRDNKIRVFNWDEEKQTYLETNTLFPPLYPYIAPDAGGFAIGDLTGDGKNEVAATWGTSVHKYINGRYRTIGYNPYVFNLGGGSADCLIGDFNNDGTNELIVTGGPLSSESTAPEVVIFKLTPLGLIKVAEWNNPSPGNTYVYFPGIGDINGNGKNELVVGSGDSFYVLEYNQDTGEFEETIIKQTGYGCYPFGCVLADSTGDGNLEIHLSYLSPMISIIKWNEEEYELIFEIEWPGEEYLIEALAVGDVNNDGNPEVCAGTDLIHILKWNGTTYVEKAVLPTFGTLAVLAIGDCTNDGKNEIQAGSVIIDHGQDFMSWVFKYEENPSETPIVNAVKASNMPKGSMRVNTKSNFLNLPLKNASVAAWHLETNTWYDMQPERVNTDYYSRNDLPEGDYLLRAYMEGYTAQETPITIVAGQETTYTFSLKLADLQGFTTIALPSSMTFMHVVRQYLLFNQQNSRRSSSTFLK